MINIEAPRQQTEIRIGDELIDKVNQIAGRFDDKIPVKELIPEYRHFLLRKTTGQTESKILTNDPLIIEWEQFTLKLTTREKQLLLKPLRALNRPGNSYLLRKIRARDSEPNSYLQTPLMILDEDQNRGLRVGDIREASLEQLSRLNWLSPMSANFIKCVFERQETEPSQEVVLYSHPAPYPDYI